MSAIFLSHSADDQNAATEMTAWLEGRGHRVRVLGFDPEISVPAGLDWKRQMSRELGLADAYLILCSSSSMTSEFCFSEYVHARAVGLDDLIFPVIIEPDCALWDQLEDHHMVDLTRTPEIGYPRLKAGLAGAGLELSTDRSFDRARPPWPGLRAYSEQDAAVFFGRDIEIREGLKMLARMKTFGSSRIALIVGAQGAGKTSLLHAGLLPRLRFEPDRWIIAGPLRLRENPMSELQAALGTVRKNANGEEATLLICVEGMEDLFGGKAQEPQSEQANFLKTLRRLLDTPDQDIMLLGTLDSRYLHKFQMDEALGDLPVEDIKIGSLSRAQVGQILTGPSKLAGIEVDQALKDAVLSDLQTPHLLPKLAVSLHELWTSAGKDRHFGIDDFQKRLGGLDQSIKRVADGIVADRSPEDLAVLCDVFIQMSHIGGDGQHTRRAVRVEDLPVKTMPLIERFIDRRLLSRIDTVNGPVIEIAHASLYALWPRLRGWLEAERETRRLRDDIVRAAEQWREHDAKDHYLLHTGARLREVYGLQTARRLPLDNKTVVAYLKCCAGPDAQPSDSAEPVQPAPTPAPEPASEPELKPSSPWQRLARPAMIAGLVVFASMSVFFAVRWNQVAQVAATTAVEKTRAETALAEVRKSKAKLDNLLQDNRSLIRRAEIQKQLRQNQVRLAARQKKRVAPPVVPATPKLAVAKAKPEKFLAVKKQSATPRKPATRQPQPVLPKVRPHPGERLLRAGKYGEALVYFRKDVEVTQRIANARPGAPVLQRDLSVSLEKLGDVLLRAGKLDEALGQYRRSHQISRALAAANVGNVKLQRDLSISFNKLGDVLLRRGRRDEALQHYQRSLKIRKRLARLNPDNTQQQRDLSVSLEKLGNVLFLTGQRQLAMVQYEESLAIAEQLAAKNPENTRLQTDLAIAYIRQAGAGLIPRGNLSKALVILKQLDGKNRLSGGLKGWIPEIENRLKSDN